MTEYEKMLNGFFYNGDDPQLMKMWYKGKRLIHLFNQLPADCLEERYFLLSQLLGKTGKNLWIVSPFFVDYGSNIYFGDNCEVNMNCTFLDDNKITIGNNVLIAPKVQIYTATHPLNGRMRFDKTHSTVKTRALPVSIRDNSWIGGGTIILPGVTIGENVVIGAGSVVTKNIPDNTIACGNPCCVIRINAE